MEYTTIYKVYGCNEEGKPILWAEFLDLKLACQYAVLIMERFIMDFLL